MSIRKLGSRKYGGFPRTGNHLLRVALEQAFPNDHAYWCEHRISPIDAPGYFWTIIRNPLDAVRSWHYFFDDGRGPDYSSSLRWYVEHQIALHRNHQKVITISFEQAITDITALIRKGASIEGSQPVELTHLAVVESLRRRFPRNHPDHSPTNRTQEASNYVDQELLNEAFTAYQHSLDLFNIC